MLPWTPPPLLPPPPHTHTFLPELIHRKLMVGIPGSFRNQNFVVFVGIRVAIVVVGEGRTWAICIVPSGHI